MASYTGTEGAEDEDGVLLLISVLLAVSRGWWEYESSEDEEAEWPRQRPFKTRLFNMLATLDFGTGGVLHKLWVLYSPHSLG